MGSERLIDTRRERWWGVRDKWIHVEKGDGE